ncbi:MAG: hypothetical protein ABFD54_04425 [Armatimonadota bacterium]
MTVSYWRVESQKVIAEVLKENKGADTKTLRKALRDAYPFGERMYHPYKIWRDECRRALTTPSPTEVTGPLFGEVQCG